jgi:hypothetical protein
MIFFDQPQTLTGMRFFDQPLKISPTPPSAEDEKTAPIYVEN